MARITLESVLETNESSIQKRHFKRKQDTKKRRSLTQTGPGRVNDGRDFGRHQSAENVGEHVLGFAAVKLHVRQAFSTHAHKWKNWLWIGCLTTILKFWRSSILVMMIWKKGQNENYRTVNPGASSPLSAALTLASSTASWHSSIPITFFTR